MLFHGSQLRVGALGNGSVSESADGYFIGNFYADQFAGIQYARGCLVVDGKEAVRAFSALQQVGSDGDGAFAGVAQQNHAVVHRNLILLHGIQIAVPAVFGNLQVGSRTIEKDTLASGLYHVFHCGKRAGIVVYHYSFGFQSRADAVVKDDGDVIVQQFLVMVVSRSVLGK